MIRLLGGTTSAGFGLGRVRLFLVFVFRLFQLIAFFGVACPDLGVFLCARDLYRYANKPKRRKSYPELKIEPSVQGRLSFHTEPEGGDFHTGTWQRNDIIVDR